MKAYVLLLINLLSFGLCSEQQILDDGLTTASTIRDALLANAVIPEVLDDFEPRYYINIDFPTYHEKVRLGNKIKTKHVLERPIFTLHELTAATTPGKTYTLALTDPDATSNENPKWSEMCHWIVTNLTTPLPGDPPAYMDIPGELIGYMPPAPPKHTGPHRYVFVLLEGDTDVIKAPTQRKHWGYGKVRHGVRDWAKENGLTVVGANFFYAEHAKHKKGKNEH